MQSFTAFSKRYLLPYLLVLVVVLLGLDYLTCQVVLTKDCEGGTGKMYRLYNMPETYKYPILGSSRARCSFVPTELGKGFFNFGMDGTAALLHFTLADQLAKTGKCPYIIINFDPNVWYSLGDINNYLAVAREPGVSDLLDMDFLGRDMAPWQRYTGLRFVFNYDVLLRDYLKYRYPGKDSTFLGYTHYRSKPLVDEPSFPAFIKKYNSSADTASYTEADKQISELVKRNPQQKFIIVFTPAWHDFESPRGHDIEKASARLDYYKAPNVTILNYYNAGMPKRYFRDPRHLNEEGATAFSRMVADTLQRLGFPRE